MRGPLLAGLLLILTPIAAGLSSCDNGGYLTASGTCNCPSLWTNDPLNTLEGCTVIQCVNGGYPKPDGSGGLASPQRCICPTGYLGVHCDAVATFPPPVNLFPSSASFTLVYINLLSNYWGGLVYSQFQTALTTIIDPAFSANKWLITNQDSPNAANTADPASYNFSVNGNLTLNKPMSPGTYSCYGVPFYQLLVNHIKNKGIRESAITILTQHPGQEDSQSLGELTRLCRSFDVRINVVFSDDQTFVRCAAGDLNELRNLAKATGGIFVTTDQTQAISSNYSATGTIIDMVLYSHVNYQPITMSLSGSVTFTSNVPIGSKQVFVVAYGKDQSLPTVIYNASHCVTSNTPGMVSGDYVQAYTLSTIGTRVCFVSFAGADRVQVFGTNFDVGPISVRLYRSFLEASYLDTSMIQPNKGNDLYVSLHVESLSTLTATLESAAFYQGTGVPKNLTMNQRSSSALEYISTETINCDPSPAFSWIQLNLRGSGVNPEYRYIPVFCQSSSSSSPLSTSAAGQVRRWENDPLFSSHNEAMGHAHVWGRRIFDDASSTPVPSTPVAASSTPMAPPAATPKTFVVAFSDVTTIAQHNSYILGSLQARSAFFPYSDFGEIRFDVDCKESQDPFCPPAYHGQTDYPSFKEAVTKTYNWNDTIQLGSPFISQVITALQALAENVTNGDIEQNSLISVNLGRMPSETANLSDFYPFVNKNVKVVFFIDSASLDSPVIPWTDTLNQIAALTSGHFIVCNEEISTPFQNLLTQVYTQGPGQKLLFARNFAAATSPKSLGTVYLGNTPGNVNVMLTFTTNPQSNDGGRATTPLPQNVLIGFTYPQDSNITQVTATLTQTAGSNFYSATVNLTGGYDVTLSLTQAVLYSGSSMLRVWTPYLSEVDVQIQYKDLSDGQVEGPDDFNGATPVVNLQTVTISNPNITLDVTYTDCAGNKISLYDSQQQLPLGAAGTDLHYVPFFCTSTTSSTSQGSCPPGTESLYYAQYSGGNDEGFAATKAFICQKKEAPTVAGCGNMDSRGNYMCGGTKSPYKRGRAGMLIDCTDPDKSNLVYNADIPSKYPGSAPFECNCPGEGPSCENSICDSTALAGSTDAMYRTYSVVVAINDVNTQTLQSKEIFTNAVNFLKSKDPQPSNIWQYQFFVVCPTGEITTQYIGWDPSQFWSSFNTTSNCSQAPFTFTYELSNIYSRVVASVGTEQRGLIVFYHEMDSSFKTASFDVASSEDFIEMAQRYKQQMYVFNVIDSSTGVRPLPRTPAFTQALMSTGGNVVIADYAEYDDARGITSATFFQDILSQSTSLNAHEPSSSSVSSDLEATSYLILSPSSGGTFTASTFKSVCILNDDDTTMYGVVCKLKDGTSLTMLPAALNNVNVTYSVLTAQPSAPLAIFITQKADDRQTSLPVNYTTGGPTMAIYASSQYSIVSNQDVNARVAQRQASCTYKYTTVDVFQNLAAGYNSIKMVMSLGATNVTKVFPFGVASSIDCKNGGTIDPAKGQCSGCADANYEGPDCSLPICQNGGFRSTWSNACICQPNYVGQFCQTPTVIPTTVAPSTTAIPSTTGASSTVSGGAP